MILHLKLQHILFLTFTIIASLPVIILGYWIQLDALENEITAVEEKHLLVAKNITRDLNRYVFDIKNSFDLVISNLLLKNKISGIQKHLETFNIRYIYITDNNGNIKINTKMLSSPNHNKMDDTIWNKLHDSINKSKETNDIIFTNLIRTKKNETTIFIIKHIKNNLIAIAALSLDYFHEVQKQISFGRRGHVAIVDKTGRAIAHPVTEWVMKMKDMSFLPPVKKMINGETGVSMFYTPAMNGDVIAGYTIVKETGWGVMVPQPFEELEERARSTQNTVLIIMLLGISIAGLISWFLAGLLVGPIHSVVNATKFSADMKNKIISPVEVPKLFKIIPKEILELINSFNNMGKRLNSLTEQLYSKIDFANKEVHERNLKLKKQAMELQKINEELEKLSTTDNLTNLFNRRLFDDMLETEFAFSNRHDKYLSLIILDIDHFKSINDKYGHIQGDQVLVDIAYILKKNIRVSDVAFRIGGEEFAILCRQSNYDESIVIAENLRKYLELHTFKNKILNVTGSFGIITIPEDSFNINDTETFYRYADKAMYHSKSNNRNCVTHYRDITTNSSLESKLK